MNDAYADLNTRLRGVSPATLSHRLERSGLRYFGYASFTSRRIWLSSLSWQRHAQRTSGSLSARTSVPLESSHSPHPSDAATQWLT